MKKTVLLAICGLASLNCFAQNSPSTEQLAGWLKRFPEADTNKDGILNVAEADAYRKQNNSTRTGKPRKSSTLRGAPRTFKVDPGWSAERFPEHAVCYKSPAEIVAIFEKSGGFKAPAVRSYPKPEDGSLRIVGTGHSFMAPGYGVLPKIGEAAGFSQKLYTHTGGGITGSTRYKWEQENGIFEFDGKPKPKLLASIANAEWDAMMWGPYFNDRPEYYSCWIKFCLKTNPDMKFYLSDAWPQLYQLESVPKSEDYFTEEIFDKMNRDRTAGYRALVKNLRENFSEQVYILPTSDAMTIAAKHYLRGELPGVEGINKVIGKKERSLWKDHLGHLGPGFNRLEGYVFYATLYGKSPELIEKDIQFRDKGDFPSLDLDKVFRKIAWQAVIGNPLSGVTE